MELVIDAGNKNIKSLLLTSKGQQIDKNVIPSNLRFTNDCDFVEGGFKLNDNSGIVGWDNVNRHDTISIIDDSRGKIKYLPYLIAGTISHYTHVIKQSSVINCHVLTLQINERDAIQSAIDIINEGLTIDRVNLNIKLKLVDVYPEGFGNASLSNDSDYVHILDIGGGTMNLSRYSLKGKTPRRQYFNFVPCGLNSLINLIKEELKYNSSNGVIDDYLLNQALETNTYTMYDSYEGNHIWEQCYKAAQSWISSKDVKKILIPVVNCLQRGEKVICCGGSWQLSLVKEVIIDTFKPMLSDNKLDNLIFPDDPTLSGVMGLQNILWKNTYQI